MKENKTHLFVDNYGELLAQVNDMELISFETDNGYQGDYCAVLMNGERLFYYIGSYGSCSGCDWLEAEDISDFNSDNDRNGKNYKILYKDALDYCGDIKPMYIVPKNSPMKIINKGAYNGFDVSPQSLDTNNKE